MCFDDNDACNVLWQRSIVAMRESSQHGSGTADSRNQISAPFHIQPKFRIKKKLCICKKQSSLTSNKGTHVHTI